MRRSLHIALPVLLGGLVYCAFRSTDHLLFRWAEAAALGPGIDWLRSSASALRPANGWLLYSLPDGLWLYAFTFWMHCLWPGPSHEERAWRALPLGLALGSELAQGLLLLQGTFDLLDVATYLVAYSLATATARTQAATEALT